MDAEPPISILLFLRRLFQQLFGLVDLCSEVRATAAIGMIQQHELTVLFTDDVARESAFTVVHAKSVNCSTCRQEGLGETNVVSKISAASFLVIFCSKPPL